MSQRFVMVSKRSSAPPVPILGQGNLLWNRFSYIGSVRLPNFQISGTTRSFAFIEFPFVYDPVHDNYIVGCHDHHDRNVIRISLPAPVPHAQDGTTTGLPQATVLMDDWVDITDGKFEPINSGHTVGGLIIHDNKIWWLQEPNYNVGEGNFGVIGHVNNTSDLTALNGVSPWYADINYKNICRAGCVIPETWATANVGGKRFLAGVGTGVAGYKNRGPVAIAIDKPTSSGQTLTTTNLVYFPSDEPFIWSTTGLEWHGSHQQMSMQWIEDGSDNWVIQTGVMTKGQYAYKGSSPCHPNEGGYWGYPWMPYLIVYHADDLIDSKQPKERYPREIIDLSQYFIRQNTPLTCTWRFKYATAWNPTLKWFVVMESRGRDEPFDDLPVLHVFELGGI